jgi:hypothetical protein
MDTNLRKHYQRISRENLKKDLDRVSKYKNKNSDSKVNLAIEGISLFHGTSQENIMGILNTGKIKTKNLVGGAEMSNNGSDFVMGLNRHVCMSIGKPWLEYGNYFFTFGLKNISETAFFFKGDPWLYNNKELEESFLTKQDYVKLQRVLLRKNLLQITRKRVIKIPFNYDLHKLVAFNSRKYEVKNDSTLSIKDADEFICFTTFDTYIIIFNKLFGNWVIFAMLILCYVLMFAKRYLELTK